MIGKKKYIQTGVQIRLTDYTDVNIILMGLSKNKHMSQMVFGKTSLNISYSSQEAFSTTLGLSRSRIVNFARRPTGIISEPVILEITATDSYVVNHVVRRKPLPNLSV